MVDRNSSSETLSELAHCMSRVANERDKSAFAALFDHYAPQIRAFSLTRDPGADLVADELVQEVMTRVWLKADRYNKRLANLNTWIFTLARNCRIDYLRRNGRHISDIDPTYIFDTLEDNSSGPFQQAQQNRSEEGIRAGLKQLPREQAEILTQVFMEGKSHQKVSEELKLPLGTVKSRVRLALKKLEVLIER
jgi:RNA polymerase sigma-70 factor (ECF subfamily)